MQIVFALLLFSIIIHVIIYINDFTMLHIFNNMHPSGFLPDSEYFCPTVLRTSIDWIMCFYFYS